jgi:hypothetical protein
VRRRWLCVLPDTRQIPAGNTPVEVLASAIGELSSGLADEQSTNLARTSPGVTPATRIVTFAELAAEHSDFNDLTSAFGTFAQMAAHKTFTTGV